LRAAVSIIVCLTRQWNFVGFIRHDIKTSRATILSLVWLGNGRNSRLGVLQWLWWDMSGSRRSRERGENIILSFILEL
jgi:hypothetical protein